MVVLVSLCTLLILPHSLEIFGIVLILKYHLSVASSLLLALKPPPLLCFVCSYSCTRIHVVDGFLSSLLRSLVLSDLILAILILRLIFL
jgi:hypothetical protein